MTDTTSAPDHSQKSYRKPEAYQALEDLISAAGFDAGDLQTALNAIQEAKTHRKSADTSAENNSFSLRRHLFMRMLMLLYSVVPIVRVVDGIFVYMMRARKNQ